jgi:hypothetical protein
MIVLSFGGRGLEVELNPGSTILTVELFLFPRFSSPKKTYGFPTKGPGLSQIFDHVVAPFSYSFWIWRKGHKDCILRKLWRLTDEIIQKPLIASEFEALKKVLGKTFIA